MNKCKLLISSVFLSVISIAVLASGSTQGNADVKFELTDQQISNSYTDKTARGVTMAMIPEFQEKPALLPSIQPIPLHTAELLNFINKDKKVTASDVIKFSHPNLTAEEINNTQGTFDESLSYIKNQGFDFTKVTGFPDWKVIADELNAQRPVLVHLKANSSYWLEQETTVIIWGIQAFDYEGQPTNVLYFTRSLNHADGAIYSGFENSFDLLSSEKTHDPTLQVTYSWADTVYGFKK